ncbi:4595_t:CDS:2, partial [Acaulospora colombiana]
MTHSRIPVWLDCDPGHDDAIAILLAVHCPNIHLLGVSTVSDLAPVDVHAHRGATKPLMRPARHDPEIHGEDGLGGVEGLPTLDDPAVNERVQLDGRRPASDGMAKAI